jgi:transcriptional regulator with XRE-family HTH domain
MKSGLAVGGRRSEDDPTPALRLELRWARQERGLSQGQLAKLTGVTRQQISQLESPDTNPTLATLHKVASALGMDVQITSGRSRRRRRELAAQRQAPPKPFRARGFGFRRDPRSAEWLSRQPLQCALFVNMKEGTRRPRTIAVPIFTEQRHDLNLAASRIHDPYR